MYDTVIQELSDKVLIITFPSIVNEDARDKFRKQLEDLGFKVVWMVR